MSSNSILVLGSLHYDILLESENLPRTGETIIGKKWYPKLGGKGGNQAIAASSYPAPTKLISAVGDDSFATYILENINKTKVDTTFVQILKNCKSGMSVAISKTTGDYGAIVVSGANYFIDPKIFDNSDVWENTEILMIQNELQEETNLLAATKAKKQGLKIVYNAAPAKKINPNFYELVDILIVNTIEAEDITQKKITNLSDIFEASKLLANNFPIVIISSGELGVVMCEKQKDPLHFKGNNVQVKSTHGAGDMFAGTLCACLISRKNINQAIDIANQKAAEFVSN